MRRRILMMLGVLALLALPREQVQAKEVKENIVIERESEPEAIGITHSELDEKAIPITLNQQITDAITESANEEKWYRFEIEETGHFDIEFSSAYEGMYGWNVAFYKDDTVKSFKDYQNKKNINANILSYGKGIYYVKVSPYYAGSSTFAPVGQTFSLKVNFIQEKQWEDKNNNKSSVANNIVVNTGYGATLNSISDTDWYKVNVDKAGYFRIAFNLGAGTDIDDVKNGWAYTVYDSKFKEIYSKDNIKTQFTTKPLPWEKGVYYVKVEAAHPYVTFVPTGKVYNIAVKHTETDTWESEGNNSRTKADTVSLNKKYNGIFTKCNDVDWYKVSVKKGGVINFTFNKENDVNIDSVGNGWNVYFYEKNSTSPIAKLERVQYKDSFKVNVKKGTYYVKVVANSLYVSQPTKCQYQFKANYSPAPSKATLKSVSSKAKKVTLQWKKVNNATGYYVYRSTSKNGSYKKIATIKKAGTVKYIDKKVKSGKQYYYKVVAYNKANGVTAVAKDSNIKNIKVRK